MANIPMTTSGEGYYFTEEEWLLKKNVRDLVEKEISPRFKENETEETAHPYYKESMKRLGEEGFLRVFVPESLGGFGMRLTALLIVVEEVARGNGAIAIHALENPLLGTRMAMATPEAWKKYGEDILDGNIIFASSQCSPEGQINYPEQAEIGRLEGDEWVLNGEKAFCSGGTFCDYLNVCGLYKGDLHRWAMSPDTPGLTIHHNPEIGTSPTSASLTLKNVRIPKDMGGPTGAVVDRKAVPETMGAITFHTGVCALALGSAGAALEKTIEYLTHRTTNFKPVASLGAIQAKFVDMKMKLEAARSMLYMTARMIETNYKDAVLYSHLAKVFCCDTARWITAECVQMHGCVGVNPESGISRHMMDAVVFGVGASTSDMHINGAAKAMGLPTSDNELWC